MVLSRLWDGFRARAAYELENLRLRARSPRPGRLVAARAGGTRASLQAPELNVIMCTWKRIPLLESTVDDLNCQTGVSPHLHVWNNNFAASGTVESLAERANFPVTITHSEINVGGYGRFFAARELSRRLKADGEPVVFIDDDQVISPGALRTLLDEYRPDAIRSIWAFRFKDGRHYWQRTRALPGEPAHYCGTCGMIAPLRIFEDPRIFQCPPKFWFIEDLWLSFVAAHEMNLQLLGSAANIDFTSDGLNQVDGLAYRKSRMLRHLTGQLGWDLNEDRLRPTPSTRA